ncbi:MAG: F0F1 ATP synthase subunit A [Chloroflexota bacterium]
MRLSPDETIVFSVGILEINATIFYTWIVMTILVAGSWLITRRLTADERPSHWQALLESVVVFMQNEIRAITDQAPAPYLPFAGTLLVFIAVSNLIGAVPGFASPTTSLSLTTALALCAFFAVPFYGIRKKGVLRYLRVYIQPNPIMLPFNLISDVSRTLSLSVRLFGNMMSGQILVAIMVSLIPLFVPVLLEMFGLVIGLIQAYIFTVLTLVYIGGATSDT